MRIIQHYSEPKVSYIGHYGGDKTHAGSAWVSTGTEVEQNEHRIGTLLEMLILNEHGTPFESSLIHFQAIVDQATHIHLLKHRVGVSINGESARYKELTEDRILHPRNINSSLVIAQSAEKSFQDYHTCLEAEKTTGTSRKRAKESCRYFLPMNSMITLDVKMNFRSWMHFDMLRNSPHAQLEVRLLAEQVRSMIEEIEGKPFELSLKAYDLYKEYKELFVEFVKDREKLRKGK